MSTTGLWEYCLNWTTPIPTQQRPNMTKFAVIEALNEPERMARILQKRSNVNSNTLNPMYNRTPILRATHSGNDTIVRILLVQNDINPIEVDKWSWRI